MKAALISAAVAFIVLVLTHVITHRREHSRLLLGKLEELYFLLLSLGERNGRRFDPFISDSNSLGGGFTKLSFEEILASDLLEKIRLFVEFYFPSLQPELEAIFEANRECLGVLTPVPKAYSEMKEVAERFPNRIDALKKRILNERRVLTRNLWFGIRNSLDKISYG